MSNIECPICKSNIVDATYAACPRCGDFTVSGTAVVVWNNSQPNLRQIANASGWIREHQGISFNSNDVESLLSVATPSVAERATKVLIHINKLCIDLSYQFSLNIHDAKAWLGVSYSDNANELYYLFRTFLFEAVGYISFTEAMGGEFLQIQITPRGYEFLESLKHNRTDSQIGFCAMWFDGRLLPVWSESISPAIQNAGYDAKRIDTHQHNNRIDDEIIAMLRQSKFVVADFVGNRAGVYFEAGFALGLGLPVIWTCSKDKLHRIHFDNRQYNFVTWEWDKLDEFKAALQNRIEATIGRGSLQPT